jgi:threonine/homoserine/homoserine lactone efflux protein
MSFLVPAPQFAAFVIIAGLLTITPGADMALVMRHALGSGTRQAWRSSNLRGYRPEWVAFAQGLFTNVLNPKVAVFYLTFLPQFVAPDRPVLPQSLFLAMTHVFMGLVWLTLYARFIDCMAAVLLTDRVKRRIEAVTGAVLMALGIRLAMARR